MSCTVLRCFDDTYAHAEQIVFRLRMDGIVGLTLITDRRHQRNAEANKPQNITCRPTSVYLLAVIISSMHPVGQWCQNAALGYCERHVADEFLKHETVLFVTANCPTCNEVSRRVLFRGMLRSLNPCEDIGSLENHWVISDYDAVWHMRSAFSAR